MTEQEQALHDSYESIKAVIDFMPRETPASLVLCQVKLALERIQHGSANGPKTWFTLYIHIEELTVAAHDRREITSLQSAVAPGVGADDPRGLSREPQVAAGSQEFGAE